MIYAIGTKVRLKHTGDEGVIDHMLEHGLLAVALGDGVVIPVPPDSLERVESEAPSSVKAKYVPGKQKVEPLPMQPLPTDSQYTILKPQGLQLAFDPIRKASGTPERYRVFLINDTQHTFLYELLLQIKGIEPWPTKGRLGPRTMVEAGSLSYSELGDTSVQVDAWRLLPEAKGTGRKLSRLIKVKPSSFFGREQTAPYLNRPVHMYMLFSTKELLEKKQPIDKQLPQEDLRSYTTRRQPQELGVWHNLQELPHEVWESAVFSNEIDLHIDKLVEDASTVPKGKILSTQLEYFERYLRQAIRVGVDRVFIIHGVGEGKLRDAIAKRLRSNKQVVSFKNEFHPRYGFGATEVEL